MPGSHPPEFRRKVLDLIAVGRTVAQVAHDLEVGGQTSYTWRRQEQVDSGGAPGLTSAEKGGAARGPAADRRPGHEARCPPPSPAASRRTKEFA